jgi:hypothetical protein
MKSFRHPCGDDSPIMRLILERPEWGIAWFGRFWRLVELIGRATDPQRPPFGLLVKDGHPANIYTLAEWLRTKPGKLIEFLNHLSDHEVIHQKLWREENRVFIPALIANGSVIESGRKKCAG